MLYRIPKLVSTAIYLAVLALGYQFSHPSNAELAVQAVVLFVGFLSPAQWIAHLDDFRLRAAALFWAFVTATFLWDLLTAIALQNRPLLSDWWFVYVAGPVTFLVLLVVHVALVNVGNKAFAAR
jgi:hypothetical protein